MIIFFPASRPASARQGEWHDQKAPESLTLVLVAIVGAGRSLARKRAGCALPLNGSVPGGVRPDKGPTRPVACPSARPGMSFARWPGCCLVDQVKVDGCQAPAFTGSGKDSGRS